MSPQRRSSRALRLTGTLAAAAIVAATFQLPAASAFAAGAPAADETISEGTDFWVAFPANYSSQGAITLYMSGTEAGTGTVSVPGQEWSADFTITAGSVAEVALPAEFQIGEYDAITAKGIHITSTTGVSVYGINQMPGTSDGYLGLPTESLGQRYRVLGYGPLAGILPSQMTVVAPSDDTTVTVTPKESLGEREAGVPFTVELDSGETYLLGSPVNDATGSVVESSKPVAVFGGAECTNVPSTAFACDHLVQQLPPTSTWGTDFLTVRLATRAKGDTYRVLANEDDTEVSVNGAPVATIDSGEYWESVLPADVIEPGSEGTAIHTSKPTLVAQYGNGTSYDNTTGDPLMMLVPPAGQYLDHYTFSAPDVGYESYASLVVPTADIGDVTLDGDAVPAESFSAIGESGVLRRPAVDLVVHPLTRRTEPVHGPGLRVGSCGQLRLPRRHGDAQDLRRPAGPAERQQPDVDRHRAGRAAGHRHHPRGRIGHAAQRRGRGHLGDPRRHRHLRARPGDRRHHLHPGGGLLGHPRRR